MLFSPHSVDHSHKNLAQLLIDIGHGCPRVADYITAPSGLQYKDYVKGTGAEVQDGNTLLIDWDGYTIGYYGRPFEARNKVMSRVK